MFDEDERSIAANPHLSAEAKAAQHEALKAQRSTFDSLFNEAAYEELRKRGDRRISYRAMQAVSPRYHDFAAAELAHGRPPPYRCRPSSSRCTATRRC